MFCLVLRNRYAFERSTFANKLPLQCRKEMRPKIRTHVCCLHSPVVKHIKGRRHEVLYVNPPCVHFMHKSEQRGIGQDHDKNLSLKILMVYYVGLNLIVSLPLKVLLNCVNL